MLAIFPKFSQKPAKYLGGNLEQVIKNFGIQVEMFWLEADYLIIQGIIFEWKFYL